jgi:hypothetical protein
MNFSVMAPTIASTLRDEEHDALDFVWHSGEPTIYLELKYNK